jgi:hypothetical protein
MCRQFEVETTAITGEHVGGMLTEFTKDPANKWGAKDAAVRSNHMIVHAIIF